jgi:hypothetical protein
VSSIRRIISSRANAAHSTGPRTAVGKLRSSRNGLRHGCRSRQFSETLLENESREEFDALLQEHLSALQPRNFAERACVDRMVFARWRQHRILALETTMWNQAIRQAPELLAAYDLLCETPGFNVLPPYEGACHQIYHHALNELLASRKKRCTTIVLF